MGREIERKYLVDHNKWALLNKPIGQFYRQGYLSTDPKKTIRVRLTSEDGFLTIKGLSIGATRPETHGKLMSSWLIILGLLLQKLN
jgi:CYTH domain-containing protein